MKKIKVLISFKLRKDYLDIVKKDFPNIELQIFDSFKEELIEKIQDVEVLFAGYFDEKMFKAAKKLKWIHSRSVGVDRLLDIKGIRESKITITSSKGIHSSQASDHAFSLILCLSRKINAFLEFQSKKKWDRKIEVEELEGKIIGIIGLGSIGNEIARKAKCFGMTVLAIKKNPLIHPDFVDEVLSPKEIDNLLKVSDFVVLSAHLTDDTKGMIGERELKLMKKSAYIINISRGALIKEDELIHFLKDGRIAGAGLDTFMNEPLPKNSELWGLKNIIITPHIAGETTRYLEKAMPIFYKNLRKFINNDTLENIVDKNAGY